MSAQRCAQCGVDYPEEILTPVITSPYARSAPICGICGLALSNEIHGARRKKFDGKQAEELRQAAIRHRKKLGVVD